MARRVEIEPQTTLEQHAEYVHLAPLVEELRAEARPFAQAMRGRAIWMINSTAKGGGVSEMLPGLIGHLRELGVRAEWVVIESDDDAFFQLTKRIHNMIHGEGEAGLSAEDRSLLEKVNRANADDLRDEIRREDLVIVHDPQPMPIAGMLAATDVTTVWRCHIGLDSGNAATADAWRFLQPYAAAYDHAVFSAPEYVPAFFEGRSSIIYPALDPLTAKNRRLDVQSVVAVLVRAGLLHAPGPGAAAPFDPVHRIQPDGSWQVALRPDDIGLLTRPIIMQVSRWDRLKGFLPLMRGFAEFKQRLRAEPAADAVSERLRLSRLVLAGPDAESIADDPEGVGVLEELRESYLGCDADVRSDIAILALPMRDPTVNALIVNALQRVSTIAVQNSLREGFGLTITEAMWKGLPVLSNSKACGPRQQVRDGVDGRLIGDPEDVDAIASALDALLRQERLDSLGRSAEQRVHAHFLIYSQLRHWIRLLGTLTGAVRAA
ncbi:MAG TPA: glycosyltransferase [Longimicrobiales bacterium]